ncbi:MAG TPA: hypothetical protein PKO06_08800 [Candidatus Ozemobacteraceae bacterium]|mgnify:CR=1 FL=1|nr:hypothetical protein [Candidatus Ozemobacteraceae bacterium]
MSIVFRNGLLCLLLILASTSSMLAETPGATGFQIVSCEGDVLHVPDGTEAPEPAKPGVTITSGRFITLESGKAELKFPSGKTFAIPANTLLMIDPKQETLENACAAAAAIRDRSVLFVLPREGETITAGKPVALLFGVQIDALDLASTSGLKVLALDAASADKPKEIELATLALGDNPSLGAGTMGYRYFRLESARGLPEGEYEIIVKTQATPAGKKVGKARAISVTKP